MGSKTKKISGNEMYLNEGNNSKMFGLRKEGLLERRIKIGMWYLRNFRIHSPRIHYSFILIKFSKTNLRFKPQGINLHCSNSSIDSKLKRITGRFHKIDDGFFKFYFIYASLTRLINIQLSLFY